MVDPKTVREVVIDLESFKREVEPRFATLTKLVFMLLAIVVGGGVGGGIAFYQQIGTLDKDVIIRIGNVRTDLAALAPKIDAIDARTKRLEDAEWATRNRIMESLDRIEGRRSPTPPSPPPSPPDPFSPLSLTRDEVQTIRGFLGLKPQGPPKYATGDTAPASEAKDVPQELYLKVPKLRGLKFLIDANGWAHITDAQYRIVAIIGPPTG
jgi:hypothetical protein